MIVDLGICAVAGDYHHLRACITSGTRARIIDGPASSSLTGTEAWNLDGRTGWTIDGGRRCRLGGCCRARGVRLARARRRRRSRRVVETSVGDVRPRPRSGRGGAEPDGVFHEARRRRAPMTGPIFHRVVKYGMVQGGDPLTKDPAKRALYGTGGQNAVKAEARAPKMTRGSVAAVMVPGKPDSAGAQFFIVLADQPALDNQYTVFAPCRRRRRGAAEDLRRRRSTTRAWRPNAIEMRHVTIRDTPAEPFVTGDGCRNSPSIAPSSIRAPGSITIEFFADKAPEHRAPVHADGGRRCLHRNGVPPRRARFRDSDRGAVEPQPRR